VKKIVDEHDARIDLANLGTGGASVSIVFRRLAGAARTSAGAAASVS
jgi:nitrogen fixation/metabolism regulation signal transduction histidine kinase